VSNEGTVAELRATIDAALAEIGKTQSALGLAKDRAQQARDILARGFSGSNRDEIAAAVAGLAAVFEIVDQAIDATIVSADQLSTYAGTL
jgi:hypothetical protein